MVHVLVTQNAPNFRRDRFINNSLSMHLLEAAYFRQLRLGRERPRSWDANVPTITLPLSLLGQCVDRVGLHSHLTSVGMQPYT